MPKPSLSRLIVAGLLALALAACGQGDKGEAGSAEKVAPVAAPAGKAWTDVVSKTPEGGWRVGNPEAPIKFVEYGSLTCPACAAFSQQAMEKLLKDYVGSGRVSYEFRSVPIHGAVDLVLTRLIDCGPREAAVPLAEQIWGNHSAIMEPLQRNEAALQQAFTLPDNQRFVAWAQAAGLYDFFATRGMSVDQARQCLADFPAIKALADQLSKQMTADEVQSTPTFFLNGRNLGSLNWAEVETSLQAAGAR